MSVARSALNGQAQRSANGPPVRQLLLQNFRPPDEKELTFSAYGYQGTEVCGVNLETAGEFLKAGACAVAVGGELVDTKSIREGRYDVIEERARQYLAVIARARADMKTAA